MNAHAGKIVAWRPHPGPQTKLLSCPVFEAMFGGARGGGKTAGMIGEFGVHADRYGRDAAGLMLRRERTQLLGTIAEADALYSKFGVKWKESDKVFLWPNGARLQMGYLERDQDADAWQGRNLTRLYVEEIGNFPRFAPIARLFATLRSSAGVPVRFRCTANPGGPGHSWCKGRYVDPAPLGMKVLSEEITNPLNGQKITRERVYIPSRVTDNPTLGDEYVGNLVLSGAGSPALVRAWLEGDWSAIEGAFFGEWMASKHIVAPFEIPKHWTRFRAADWGTARPFSIGWYAVASETVTLASGQKIPRGALIRYREWYGCREQLDGQPIPNEGLKLSAAEVAQRIVMMSQDETIEYTVIDPAVFANTGGQTIAEAFAMNGVPCLRADNTRVAQVGAMSGWNNVRQRLSGDGEDPLLFVFATCKHLIRTLPVIQHDRNRAEDVDTDAEDHACFAAGTLVNGVPIEQFGHLTRRNAKVVQVYFSNGENVVCTPDHKFMLENGKWMPASQLAAARLSSATEFKNSVARDIISAAFTFSAKAVDSIVKCGWLATGLFQRDITSIMRMEIGPTTDLQTSNALLPSDIYAKSMARKVDGAGVEGSQKRKAPPLNGTEALPAGDGIASILRNAFVPQWRNVSQKLAIFAGSLSRRAVSRQAALASAIQTVKPVHCVRVVPLSARQDVYCAATDAGWFDVAGVVTSNCDELRYACASRPWLGKAPKGDEPMRHIGNETIDNLFWRLSA